MSEKLTAQKRRLALYGGTPVRATPMPAKGGYGAEERAAALAVIDAAIASGESFRYQGPHEARYAEGFAEFMGGGFADGVNSGTNALFVTLSALGIRPRTEIIVPAIIDPGGVMPVLLHGCVPVMSDVAPESYNASRDEVEAALTDRTSAIIIAHIGGEPADLEPLVSLAAARGIPLIEDCSQAHGAEYRGRKVGSFGAVSFFSTMASKLHCSGGQGGLVYSKDAGLIERVKQCADRGKVVEAGQRRYVTPGLNCNLDELSAAIGCAQLEKLPGIVEQTHGAGERLKEALAHRSRTCAVGTQVPETKCVYWFVRVRFDAAGLTVDKQQFCRALAAEGVPLEAEYEATPFTQVWYKRLLEAGPEARPLCYGPGEAPRDFAAQAGNVDAVLASHFNILVRESFGEQEIEDIVAAIIKVEEAFLP